MRDSKTIFMKKIFLFVMIAACQQLCFGQVTKGNIMAGGSISFQSEKYTATGNTTSTFTFMPDAGYFFMDKLAGGVRASFTNYNDGGNSYHDLLAGPFVRYYFLPAAQKTNIFLDGSFMIGSEKYTGYDAQSKTQWGAKAGAAFFLNPHVAVETSLDWSSLKYNDEEGHYNTWGIAIGFQVHLDCQKHKQKK
jgi:hypothetical protein